jgi:hypothetical protein
MLGIIQLSKSDKSGDDPIRTRGRAIAQSQLNG